MHTQHMLGLRGQLKMEEVSIRAAQRGTATQEGKEKTWMKKSESMGKARKEKWGGEESLKKKGGKKQEKRAFEAIE